MKKQLILLLLCGFSLFSINAQVLGVRGGASFAPGRYLIYDTKLSSGSLFGINTAILGEFPVSDALSLGTGISFIKKGTTNADYKIPVRYLEFPVNFIYKIDFVTWNLFAQAGPYVGVGISARKKNNTTERIKFGSLPFEYKKMDYGLNLGGGFQIDNIQIGVNYGYGIINISHVNSEVIRNRVITISMTYYIEDLGYTLRNLKDAIF